MNTLLKSVFIVLLFCTIIFSNGFEIDYGVGWIGYGSKNATITNTTKLPYNVKGFRINANNSVTNFTSLHPISSIKKLPDSTNISYQWEISISSASSADILQGNNGKRSFSIIPQGLQWDDNSTNFTPTDIQWLFKTGSFCSKKDYKDIEGISTDSLSYLVQQSWFYDSTIYVPDTLMGDRGGLSSGGVINTWYDQEGDSALWQIQMCETEAFLQNGEWSFWNPLVMGEKDAAFGTGPMYAMSLAMATEYFNLDYVLLAGSATNESMAGMEGCSFTGEWGDISGAVPTNKSLYNDVNTDLWMGTNHLEEPTYKDVIWGGCPKFFPEDLTYAHSSKYITTPGTDKCIGNSPQIANDKLIVSIYSRYIYELLNNCTEFYTKHAFSNALDKEIAAKLLLAIWNGGRNSQDTFLSKLNTDAILNDIELDWTVYGNDYIEKVYRAINPIQAGSKYSTVNGGTNKVRDHEITIDDVKSFFFGTNGSTSSGTLGNGGILHHFDLSATNRIEIWNEIVAAFNILKQNGPYSENGNISFRYDWLALMRVVKDNLDLSFPIPLNEDFIFWVKSHSQTNVIDSLGGPTIELDFPTLKKTGKIGTNDEWTISIDLKDETFLDLNSSKVVEWTIDSNWIHWQPGTFISGDNLNAAFSINVSKEYCEQWISDIEQPFTVWIKGSDSNFNSTIDAITLQFDPVNVKETEINKSNTKFFIINGRKISVNETFLKNSSVKIEIYSLDGRRLHKSKLNLNSSNLFINSLNLSNGLYLLKISTKNYSKSIKFQQLK